MLSENLKSFRKSRGITQEELATRLNIVRQTISKWEKGLSVPDSDMLIRIAEILEVNVSELLGTHMIEGAEEATTPDIAEQLSRINEQLAIKNRRSHRIWKAIAIIVAIMMLGIILTIFSFITLKSTTAPAETYQTEEQIPLHLAP